MKVLFLSSSDTSGGAAIATYRIFCALREQGISVKMLVSMKESKDPDVISYQVYKRKGWIGLLDKYIWKIKNRLRKEKWKKYPKREPVFLNDLSSVSLLRAIRSFEFDILHLNFIVNQFFDIRELRSIHKPIIWTLHDCWPFTGICHYFYGCNHYTKSCGNCPMLHSSNPKDFTYKILIKKQRIYNICKMHFVAPSNWMLHCAEKSILLQKFQITNIPYVIDTKIYKTTYKTEAKLPLGLSEGIHYVLYGAMNALFDSRKGFHLLLDALKYIRQKNIAKIELLIFGAENDNSIIDVGYPVHFMGIIRDEEYLIQIYNASDVLVVPSIEENLANAIIESLACGTPVVGFDIGGNSDMIDHKVNGYLAKPYDCSELGEGILWCLLNNNNSSLSIAARNKVIQNFTQKDVISKYRNLYISVLDN